MKNNLLDIFYDQMKSRIPGQLYRFTQIDMAYNSNHIEGNSLTYEEIKYIYDTRLIINNMNIPVDDVIEVANHFVLFNYMLETATEPLTEAMIKEYHKILKSGTSDALKPSFMVGGYKILPNSIGGITETTLPEKVEPTMKKLLREYNQLEKASLKDLVDFHCQFEKIHPFQDGNGRVGRIVLFKECLKHNIMPFIVLDSEKGFYYQGLKEYPSGTRLLNVFLFFQDKYSIKVNYYLPEMF
ncbi:Fic family protein [Clostridiales Family XIII bacterium PM5-7]